jgi:glutathione synthase/RimK-type ligase-like ATP-grasp enzyme
MNDRSDRGDGSVRRVGLLTCERHRALNDDDRTLVAPLAARGIEAVPVVWSDASSVDARVDAFVFRSTWDYMEEFPAFTEWLARFERSGRRVRNPLPLVRWNLDKRYLLDLEARGIGIIPSVVLEASTAVDRLGAVLEERGWDEAIVKPTVACSAKGLFRVDRLRVGEVAARVAAEGKDVLVQPFAPVVVERGELSFVFFRGEFSHAVRKRPPVGDFRAQEHLGGRTVLEPEPAAHLVAAARRALEACGPEVPLYARVDALEIDGRLAVMELELVEPLLYLALASGAADRLAAHIDADLFGGS